jgi:hypothetical protein
MQGAAVWPYSKVPCGRTTTPWCLFLKARQRGYSLVEQRLITLITLTAMLAAWAYAIALVGEIGSKVVGKIFDEEVKD